MESWWLRNCVVGQPVIRDRGVANARNVLTESAHVVLEMIRRTEQGSAAAQAKVAALE
jgi:hypothetical protein